MSNSFHMSMTNSSASIAETLAGGVDGDDEKPDKMELLVGDVKGKVNNDKESFNSWVHA